ncbi:MULTISPECIES: hypothetical protein [unclassified Bacillus (in: firmicutes)]|uniref:hypothetical protein n=1 Tax=unclassified Bacillus (in: firmicutes) TaxID=185979 RepID=UPI0008EDDFCC|nr:MULTISPECIES: hypothetical protein [unclassified Bacillus (in: firmicutes)]SFB18575.1 hypothetical protein SAMN02799634_107268 [Bacillus sp. UNCCL13]SFQ75837.1 hypothetical protein SAMN04488577_1376 [Bacillus sp. cl95]
MANKEEEFLLREKELELGTPLFDTPDGKILAVGDMFRGPSPGFLSEIDLNNPGQKLKERDERFD